MPIDLEMLLSSRDPLFLYSPFSEDHFAVNSFRDEDCSNHYLVRSHPKQLAFIEKELPHPEGGKSTNEPISCSRKKKVSFADDRGLSLVQVREIPGAPKWADDVLTLLLGGTKRSVVKEKKWKMAFEHPPWEHDRLVEQIERNRVVLESICVKEWEDETLCGTIKVKNLAYEKNVWIRITFDRWVSYKDVPAVYEKPEEADRSETDTYDTFAFCIQISRAAVKYGVIEFCLLFECNGQKYWDNNGGINYRLVAESFRGSNVALDDRCSNAKSSDNKVTLSLMANIENLSEINAWSTFMCRQPY